MLKEYKENSWDPVHKTVLAETVKKFQTFEAANPEPTGIEKATKEDYEMQIEMLNTLEKKYTNTGPCIDCIVFNDGEKWRFAQNLFFNFLRESIYFFNRACLDTSYEGDLGNCKLMGIYRETFDVGTLSESDQLSYSVNIYPDDNLLEIVSMCCTCHVIFCQLLIRYASILFLLPSQPVMERMLLQSRQRVSQMNLKRMALHREPR